MEELTKLDDYVESAKGLIVEFGGRLVLAFLLLIIGFWIINRFTKFIDRLMTKREVDLSLKPFLKNLVNISLKLILVIPVIQILGIATSSFLAILGSAGLAIGLALQGSLANFAGGVLLLTLKPFKVGHFIKASGEMGTVSQINIFNTILKTPDNQTVYIPNGQLAGNTIVNFSDEEKRRLVIDTTIAYDDDIALAKKTLKDIITGHDKIFPEPEPQVVVTQMGDNAVVISVRVWVPNVDFWLVNFELQEKIKLAYDKAGITIPFPQTTLSFTGEAEKFLRK